MESSTVSAIFYHLIKHNQGVSQAECFAACGYPRVKDTLVHMNSGYFVRYVF